MRIQSYDIIPALQPYIKLICTMDCDEDVDTHQIRVLPDTCVELFMNYTSIPVAVIDHELHQQSIITARMSRPVDVQMRKGAGCLAVCFYPGMAYPFFPVPMHTLTNITVALSDVWNGIVAELEDKLAGLCTNEARADLVQQYLLQQLLLHKHDWQIAHFLSQAGRSEGTVTVNELSAGLALSQRQLSRKFQEKIGLSPKVFLSVSRFVRSLAQLKAYPHISLTAIACKSGYYDQAHFIRDYKVYSGYAPRKLVNAADILF